MRRLGLLCFGSLALSIVTATTPVGAAAREREPSSGAPSYRIPRLDAEIAVDGVLDEAAWQQALVFDLPWETNPGENVPSNVETECRLFYTDTHLYYGCHAKDPQPEGVRARFRDRDASSAADDTVGISLDPFNARNRSYVLDVNPLGVQNDRIYTEANGNSDPTWDTVWTSKGRLVADGFVVEVEIPFVSLRFPRSASEQTWGFNFRRYRPRDVRYRMAIVPNDRNNSCRLCQGAELVGFEGIDLGRNLEITPTLTGIQSSSLDDDGELVSDDADVEPGLNVRWGFTPNLSLNLALNPDFSQIEADELQLDINRPFTLFYAERRPFFLEGRDYFGTAIQAVYTRAVADPAWGTKVSGKEGKNAVGAFAARDEQTNILLPGTESSTVTSIDDSSDDVVLRYRRDVAESSTAGVLYTDRSAGDYSNRVAGVDTQLRLSTADQLNVQLLGSSTRYTEQIVEDHGQPSGQLDGWALDARYRHQTRNWGTGASYRDIADDFRADLGFVPQVGFRNMTLDGSYRWFGDAEHWFTTLNTNVVLERSEDQNGDRLRDQVILGVNYSGPLQSQLFSRGGIGEQVYQGTEFDRNWGWLEGSLNPNGSVGFGGFVSFAETIDFEHVRPGDSFSTGPWIQLQLGRHLDLQAWHSYRQLDVEGGTLFEANQVESRILYQFNTRSLVRAVLQYTTVDRDPDLYEDEVSPSEEDLFTQLLFSYKVNARSAVYLGYSGGWFDENTGSLVETGNSFFAKLSYNWRP